MDSISKAWLLVYSLLIAAVTLIGLLMAGGPTGIDRVVLGAVETSRSTGLTPVVSAATEVFSPVMVAVWALLAAAWLLMRDRRVHRAATVLGAVGVAAVVTEAIKLVVDRPRPPAADQIGSYEAALAYPSGHVCDTAALLVVVALLGTTARRRDLRTAATVAALLIAGLVAWTRLYLGVHWLSDVAAALVIGAITAAMATAVVPRFVDAAARRVGDRVSPRAAQWLMPAPPAERRELVGADQ